MANHLFVLIPTCDRFVLLKRTLDSLVACQKPEIYRKTVVVENGAGRDAEELVRSYKDALDTEYLHEPLVGISRALNRGLTAVEDALVVFTNDDVLFEPNHLNAYALAAKADNAGEFYGGPVDIEYEKHPPEWLHKYLPCSSKGWGLHGIHQERHQYFIGLNWAAFSSDIKKVGGFHPALGLGASLGAVGEETEIQKRLLQAGTRQVFVPHAKVTQYVSKKNSSPSWALKRRYQNGMYHGFIGRHDDALDLKKQIQKALSHFSEHLRNKGLIETFRWIAYFLYVMGYACGRRKRQKYLRNDFLQQG